MKRPWVVHPFWSGLYPVVTLLSRNTDRAVIDETLLPLAAIEGFVAVALLASKIAFGDCRRTGLLISIFALAVFGFGPVAIALHYFSQWRQVSPESSAFLIAWCAVWGGAMVATAMCCRRLDEWTRNLNVVTSIAVVAMLIPIGIEGLGVAGARHRVASLSRARPGAPTASRQPVPAPDIYYVILDRYPSARTLAEAFDFDNTAFEGLLAERGFYIATDSRSNYLKTAHSLASSLNFDYLDYLTDAVGRVSKSWLPLYDLLQDYRAWRFLKAQGYRFVSVGSTWQPTSWNRAADVGINEFPLPEFATVLYEPTLLQALGTQVGPPFFAHDTCLEKWRRTKQTLARMADLPSMPGPKFVFAHLLLPHEPYVFDADGGYLDPDTVAVRTERENFLNQLAYANREVAGLVERWLDDSRVPPVIIVQGDEGPFPARYRADEEDFDWTRATREELRLKTGILNALYLPGVDRTRLYPSMTPVNSFRVVFNQYFDTRLEMLPDRTYAFVNGRRLYDFFDVTDRMR